MFRLFLAGSVPASLLSVPVCCSFDSLDSQDRNVTATPKSMAKKDAEHS